MFNLSFELKMTVQKQNYKISVSVNKLRIKLFQET